MRKRYEASITVFLAMVFLLVVSVVLVSLESARVTAVKSCVEMTLSQGLDSILASYYRPMFEEYQIFGRYQKEATDELRREAVQEELKGRLSLLQNQGSGLDDLSGTMHTALKAEVNQIEQLNLSYLPEQDGAGFYHQACDAAKFYGLERVTDGILDKFRLITESSKAGKVFAMQSEAEKSLAELDEITLSLMELIDGIQVKDGKICCTGSFVKQPVLFPTDMRSVKINHEAVYGATEPFYLNKEQCYSQCIVQIESILTMIEQVEALQESIRQWKEELKQLEEQYDSITEQNRSLSESIQSIYAQMAALKEQDEDADTSGLEAQINGLQASLDSNSGVQSGLSQRMSDLGESVEQAEQKIEQLENQEQNCYDSLYSELEAVDTTLGGCNVMLQDAVSTIERGIQKQQDARKVVKKYESDYSELSKDLMQELKEPLDEELEEMKHYVGLSQSEGGGSCYDYASMRESLGTDLTILGKLTYPSFIGFSLDKDSLAELLVQLKENQKTLSSYTIENLEFDYSTLHLEPGQTKSAIDEVKNTLEMKLLDLVVEDSEKISKKKIDTDSLPSTLAGVYHVSWDAGSKSSELSILDQNVMTDLFECFGGLWNSSASGEEVLKELADLGLFQAYINSYFKGFVKEEDPSVETILYPSVLDYEKEYICFKNDTDAENLSEMASSLFLIRFGVSMAELFSNRQCVEKAEATAIALTAFTGLSFLVTLTKMLILTAWAMIEAWIDVAAILKGKEVDVFNNRTQHMAYHELLTVNKQVIMKKAEECRNQGLLKTGYKEYLFFFLVLQSKLSKCYTVMDLIQSNLNYRYEGGFSITNCITGVDAQLAYKVNPLYAAGMPLGGPLQLKCTAGVTY